MTDSTIVLTYFAGWGSGAFVAWVVTSTVWQRKLFKAQKARDDLYDDTWGSNEW